MRAISTTKFLEIKPKEGMLSRFSYLSFMTNDVVDSVQRPVSGSTTSRERVEPRGFFEIGIPIPSTGQQAEIVQTLEELMSSRLSVVPLPAEVVA
jgi:restriction endonuclease S subunit